MRNYEIKKLTYISFEEPHYSFPKGNEYITRVIVRREDTDGDVFYYEGESTLETRQVEREVVNLPEGRSFLKGEGKVIDPSSFDEEGWKYLSWAIARWFPDHLDIDKFNWDKDSWAIAQYCPKLANNSRFVWSYKTFRILYEKSLYSIPKKVIRKYSNDYYEDKYGHDDYD